MMPNNKTYEERRKALYASKAKLDKRLEKNKPGNNTVSDIQPQSENGRQLAEKLPSEQKEKQGLGKTGVPIKELQNSVCNTQLREKASPLPEQKIMAQFAKTPFTREEKYTLHEKGFVRAFEECMRARYYVCEALFNKEVDRKKDWLDKADTFGKNLEPAIIAATQPSMWTLLGTTAGNLITSYLQEIRNTNMQTQSKRFVDMFSVAKFIDEEFLKNIAHLMLLRFRDQINQLTVSTRDNSDIILDQKDGVVILARRLTARIALHIMRGKDETYRKTNENTYLSREDRCLKAIYNCTNDGLSNMEYLPRLKEFERATNNHLWDVVALLERTGIKLQDGSIKLYTKQASADSVRRLFGRNEQTTLHENYGFCYATEEEAVDRGFEHDPQAIDPIIRKFKVTTNERSISPTNLLPCASSIKREREWPLELTRKNEQNNAETITDNTNPLVNLTDQSTELPISSVDNNQVTHLEKTKKQIKILPKNEIWFQQLYNSKISKLLLVATTGAGIGFFAIGGVGGLAAGALAGMGSKQVIETIIEPCSKKKEHRL